MQFWSKNIVANLIICCLFLIGLWFLQDWALKDNLKYGFRDGDWWDLQHFIRFNDSPLLQLTSTFKTFGIYTNQVYYIGILHNFLGLDFNSLYQAGHIFKYLASLSVFPLVFLISKSKLVAVLSTIFYIVSYPSVGALFTVVSGDHYLGVIFMNVFFIIYLLTVIKKRGLGWLLWCSLFFNLALISNTARMYPLIPLIILIEFFLIWKNRWTKDIILASFNRLFILLLPILLILFFYSVYFIFLKNSISSGFLIQDFIDTSSLRVNSLREGNWQLLLYPFASFGSLFLHDYLKNIFGTVDLTSLPNLITYVITKPLLILLLPTLLLMFFLSKRYLSWIIFILGSESIFYLISYWMYQNWVNIDKSTKIHFDPNFVLTPAAFGFYILVLSLCIFLIWLKRRQAESLLPTICLSSAVSFFLIFFTWIFSDTQLLFMGSHRYLTAPAIGSSIFIAGTITLIFNKLRGYSLTKNIAPLILLIVIPIAFVNIQIAKNFFVYELNYAGMDGAEQTRMKNEFWAIVPNMSNNERFLFYFDETADKNNGYFDESTVLAGFEYWILFDRGKTLIKERPEPGNLRTNVQCPEYTHKSCIKLMKRGLTKVDGEEGILYADSIRYPDKPRFYKLKNFYAFRFINKHLVDIREEILKELAD